MQIVCQLDEPHLQSGPHWQSSQVQLGLVHAVLAFLASFCTASAWIDVQQVHVACVFMVFCFFRCAPNCLAPLWVNDYYETKIGRQLRAGIVKLWVVVI